MSPSVSTNHQRCVVFLIIGLFFCFLTGCSSPKYKLKKLEVTPQYFCTGETSNIFAEFGKKLDKVVIKDAYDVPLKVFKNKKKLNWTTPPLNTDIIQFKIRGHLESWGQWKRKTFYSEFVCIDNPTWTFPLRDVVYTTSKRVETITHNPGEGPVPDDFGYYQCTNWGEEEVCEPIMDCADECWINEDGEFECEYRCHEVGEDCQTISVCLYEEFVNEPYLEHNLYVTLHGLTWLIRTDAFSSRTSTLQIENLNDFPVVAKTGSWNQTIPPGAKVTTPDVHPGQLSVTGTISPPIEVLCAKDYTQLGTKAHFDNPCNFEDLYESIRLQVRCKTAP